MKGTEVVKQSRGIPFIYKLNEAEQGRGNACLFGEQEGAWFSHILAQLTKGALWAMLGPCKLLSVLQMKVTFRNKGPAERKYLPSTKRYIWFVKALSWYEILRTRILIQLVFRQ